MSEPYWATTTLARLSRLPRDLFYHNELYPRRTLTAMGNISKDVIMKDQPLPPRSKSSKGHEIQSKSIKTPPFSYFHLELISGSVIHVTLDDLTVRSYITSALSQFLGLTGTAIPIDILKVDGSECWVRVPREDLSPVLAALGGWVGGQNQSDGTVAWRVKASGNWLSVLVGREEMVDVWGL